MNRLSFLIHHAPLILALADEYCDRIPVLSTVTNLVDIIAKPILLCTGTTPTFGGKSWSERISQKPLWKCLLLCVPVLGNLIVYLMPKQNHTQETIDELFGIPNAYDQLPELVIADDNDIFKPELFTSAVMKGKLMDGRFFIAIKLKHEAEEPGEQVSEAEIQDEKYQLFHPEYFDCEKVYALFQNSDEDPNSWAADEDHSIRPVINFFGGNITDFDDGHVRGYEQEPYALLQALIKNGEGKDSNDKMWKLPGHDKLIVNEKAES